jgi:hypothetical protein
MSGRRRCGGLVENLAGIGWGCGRYTASYTRNYSGEWLIGGPARPAITTDLVKLPARLPAPHVDEKKGGSGSRAVSLRVLGSGRAGRQRSLSRVREMVGQSEVQGGGKEQQVILKDKRQKKHQEGQKGAVRGGRQGGRAGSVRRSVAGVGMGR